MAVTSVADSTIDQMIQLGIIVRSGRGYELEPGFAAEADKMAGAVRSSGAADGAAARHDNPADAEKEIRGFADTTVIMRRMDHDGPPTNEMFDMAAVTMTMRDPSVVIRADPAVKPGVHRFDVPPPGVMKERLPPAAPSDGDDDSEGGVTADGISPDRLEKLLGMAHECGVINGPEMDSGVSPEIIRIMEGRVAGGDDPVTALVLAVAEFLYGMDPAKMSLMAMAAAICLTASGHELAATLKKIPFDSAGAPRGGGRERTTDELIDAAAGGP